MADFKVLPTVNGVPISLNTHNHDATYVALVGNQDVGGIKELTDALRLSDPDVAHGMTTLVPTDVYAQLTGFHSTNGGLQIRGLSDADSSAAALIGTLGAASPTVAAVVIQGSKISGTAEQALAATEVLLDIATTIGTPLVRILGNGRTGFGGNVLPLDWIQVDVTAGQTGILLNSPSTGYATLRFAIGGTVYNYIGVARAADDLIIGMAVGDTGIRSVNKRIVFSTDSGVTIAMVLSGGDVGIGTVAPLGKLHVKQGSTTAAIPTLVLEQLDLSEEFLELTSTSGAGNPIQTSALGAYSGKFRINVNGTYFYVPYYVS